MLFQGMHRDQAGTTHFLAGKQGLMLVHTGFGDKLERNDFADNLHASPDTTL